MSQGQLSPSDEQILLWILENSFECTVQHESKLQQQKKGSGTDRRKILIEIGPRLNFSTAFSTNAVAICKATGLQDKIHRIERSIVYLLSFQVSCRKQKDKLVKKAQELYVF